MNDIVDMSRFVEAKSDQLNADDLIGAPRTITVRRVTGNDGDQPVSIYFEGDNNKPFKPCKTMRRVLLAIWGRNAADYVGRSMTLYRDDTVQFGGLNVGGIRISHMSHMEKESVVVVMKTKGKKAGIKVFPLTETVKPDATAAWVANFKSAVDACADNDALEALLNGKGKRYVDLQAKRPDLHAECEHAIAMKRDALASEDFAEGPSDDQRGDGFTDDFGGE